MEKTIFAKGEHTGNYHYTTCGDIKFDGKVIKAKTKFEVQHQEHETIEIPASIDNWSFSQVVECDPVTKKIAQVKD